MGRRKRKNKSHLVEEDDEVDKVPRSIVVARAHVGKWVSRLARDMRKVMEPYTAASLRENSTNTIKDFVSVAGPLGVSHLVLFNLTDAGVTMRTARLPRGPTLTFRVADYALAGDVLASHATPHPPTKTLFVHPPLVVLNNFGVDFGRHVHLMSVFFKNMFPAINVQTIKVSECQRVALFSYDHEAGTVEFRHFSVQIHETGLSRSVRSVLHSRIEDMSSFADIADFVLAQTESSAESDREDETSAQVPFDRPTGHASGKNAVKLHEIGPRMVLSLLKVEDGVGEGAVMYHAFPRKPIITKKKKRAAARAAAKEATAAAIAATGSGFKFELDDVDGSDGDLSDLAEGESDGDDDDRDDQPVATSTDDAGDDDGDGGSGSGAGKARKRKGPSGSGRKAKRRKG